MADPQLPDSVMRLDYGLLSTPINRQAADCQRLRLAASIKVRLEAHLQSLGLRNDEDLEDVSKESIRAIHSEQRRQLLVRERTVLQRHLPALLPSFAEGRDVDPDRLDPELVPVNADDQTGRLFRAATALWSVPVSRGYGRRMRFLVMDRHNGKLIGLFALGDPVIGMKVRDDWIGWTTDQRNERLACVLDAYVCGAVPPYNQLLGGKLVAALMGSREVAQLFEERYGSSIGRITGRAKAPRLALLTVTSALGKSSLYNRVKLPGLLELSKVGKTIGWGHFQIPDDIFLDMRLLLAMDGHLYSVAHQYGDGPNWRLRVIRQALVKIGLDPSTLKHGISRELFAMPLANNWRDYLLGNDDRCVHDLADARSISEAAKLRWIGPRAGRRPEYQSWSRRDVDGIFSGVQGE